MVFIIKITIDNSFLVEILGQCLGTVPLLRGPGHPRAPTQTPMGPSSTPARQRLPGVSVAVAPLPVAPRLGGATLSCPCSPAACGFVVELRPRRSSHVAVRILAVRPVGVESCPFESSPRKGPASRRAWRVDAVKRMVCMERGNQQTHGCYDVTL